MCLSMWLCLRARLTRSGDQEEPFVCILCVAKEERNIHSFMEEDIVALLKQLCMFFYVFVWKEILGTVYIESNDKVRKGFVERKCQVKKHIQHITGYCYRHTVALWGDAKKRQNKIPADTAFLCYLDKSISRT